MGRPENRVENHLRDKVIDLGGSSFKWTGSNGCPDRIVILPGGEVWFLELKTLQGVESSIQKRFKLKLKGLNCNTETLFGIVDVNNWYKERLNNVRPHYVTQSSKRYNKDSIDT